MRGSSYIIPLVSCAASLIFARSSGAEWENGVGSRSRALTVPTDGRTGFQRVPGSSSGIRFTNVLSESRSVANRNLLSGSGVAAGDVDGDGLCDLYFCALDGDNVLYRNLGNWKFEDITARAGVECPNLDSMGATFADIDGDGDLDLIVNTLGSGPKVFQNDGHGVFKEITDQAGVAAKTGGMSLALGDLDGNGTLDLYVANYRPTTIMDRPSTRFRVQMVEDVPMIALVDGQPATLPEYTNRFVVAPSGKILELGEGDAIFLNDGKGGFKPLSFTSGAFLDEAGQPLKKRPQDWSLAVQIHDINGDGAPDIYLCGDLFTPDRIWINDGNGKFRALSKLALRHTSTFSMGVDFADIDRDGNVDFFVVDMLSRDHTKRHVQVAESTPVRWPVGVIEDRPQMSRNTLQLNRGDGTFADIAFHAGVEASEWSWGPIFLDVDLDGYEDILVTNGQWGDFQNADVARRIEQMRAARRLSAQELASVVKMYPRLDSAKLLFRNRHDCTFEEVGAAWGFSDVAISQGTCLADLDGDGDLDVIVNNLNGEAGVYRNESAGARVVVRLKGFAGNTQGVGSKITLVGGPVARQAQEVICGGRYLSGDDPMRVFAAGNQRQQLSIEVQWRSGKRSFVAGVKANRLYEINEADAAAPRTNALPTNSPRALFEDVSLLLGHIHSEEPFEDFARQPLLPHRFSQLGPGVSWADLDGDGREDLLIGSGKGGAMRVFLNDGKGGFKPLEQGIWTQTVTRDLTTILSLGAGQVLAGSANYEDGLALGGAVKLYSLNSPAITDAVGGQESSVGPMALADVDGDGDLDLFVGGRVIPGRYPEAATSVLFKNDRGKFVEMQRFDKVGLVSGAVFSDIDGDGRPDLVLACEWGPVRVFRNEGRKFKEVTNAMGLSEQTGWWNGVTAVDLDGDGRMDLVASNWGSNTKYRTSREHPRKVYFGDLDGNGTVEVVETYYHEDFKKEVPDRGLRAVGAAIPSVTEKWTSFEAYGKSGVSEIYGEAFKTMKSLEVKTLMTTAFLNRGDHFEARALPREAQYAPAFGVSVADFDGDGTEDVFLSQNFFAVNPDSGRCDAGRGLLLRGDGKGNLTAVSGQESGLAIYGEQRASAVSDYDADGRPDLVVTQNGNATKLYRNVGAKPGLRVRLKGAPGNTQGIGAKLRVMNGNAMGPTREIHAGSGYWSHDGAVIVLGTPTEVTRVWLQWSGGKTVTVSVPAGAKEIEISQ
ncbi:MAG: hypothetical protein EXS31_09580 [Pedosphaera sp.]|nr:hypothetical protein [Pedosphaera sp.]